MRVRVRGEDHEVVPGVPVRVPLDGHGPRIEGVLGDRPKTGGTRADGSRITAGVPDPMPLEEGEVPEPLLTQSGVPEPGLGEHAGAHHA